MQSLPLPREEGLSESIQTDLTCGNCDVGVVGRRSGACCEAVCRCSAVSWENHRNL